MLESDMSTVSSSSGANFCYTQFSIIQLSPRLRNSFRDEEHFLAEASSVPSLQQDVYTVCRIRKPESRVNVCVTGFTM